ncbi:MAG TPA: sulfite exporter TauE/SafE family protein [Gemmatimonadaceae bacterium]|nr:sulfite exporter TauE/SafE family protein [Gemmatimonadaceae bacterium]
MQLPTPTGSTTARNALFVALALITIGFLVALTRALRERAAAGEQVRPTPGVSIISFIANFFDTLGIGSFATTTSMVRQWKLIADERLPGSLNVGYVIPTVLQAYIYTTTVPVDSTTLTLMIVAAVLGAWLGAGVVSSWGRRTIQVGMGLALLVFAAILVAKQPQVALLPSGGDALALSGTKLIAGLLANFVLGALMTLGVGLYAPCMILVSLLGMNPIAAFPIMMGSCAFLMPMASIRFLKTRAYEPRAILGMLLPGIPAVLIAAFVVKTLPPWGLPWLVVVVVTYTAINMLRAARRERDIASAATSAEAQPASL